MKKLPSPEHAFIDITKLTGYCLNPEHTEGQHKAAVFKSALNVGLEEANRQYRLTAINTDKNI